MNRFLKTLKKIRNVGTSYAYKINIHIPVCLYAQTEEEGRYNIRIINKWITYTRM